MILDNCPACFAMPTQREHMKQLLAQEEAQHPRLFRNLRTTLKPLMTEGGIPPRTPADPPESCDHGRTPASA